jgi:hypothetical protein
MTVRETLAAALFAKWSIEGSGFPDRDWEEPEWEAYKTGDDLNSVHLNKDSFLEEADWLLDLIKPHLATEVS